MTRMSLPSTAAAAAKRGVGSSGLGSQPWEPPGVPERVTRPGQRLHNGKIHHFEWGNQLYNYFYIAIFNSFLCVYQRV